MRVLCLLLSLLAVASAFRMPADFNDMFAGSIRGAQSLQVRVAGSTHKHRTSTS